MKERGMIFNGEMVRAILDGRKTQTRRPVKFPVHDKNLGCELAGNELAGELSAGNYLNSAFGKPGDRIWVREAYRFPASLDDVSPTGVGEMAVATGYRKPWAPTFYEFTGTFSDGWKGFETPPKVSDAGKLRPSIHMPRWASRILLEITDMRVERLNAISEEDAEAEGIDMEALYDSQDCYDCIADHNMTGRPTVTGAFKYLWESIYGEEGWKSNPWVWVIEFKRVEGGAA
ncbi:ASCH domain-containing protein [Klebsiella pneumoniae]|uniref:morphogenetic protein n=1 Tax=Klebsiella pneumoniae TaxID=573 RepID=UPI000E2D8ED9|nr:morphogenetic protein [Klebsiella pneumoniae]SWO44298.1 morphogenetic protein [Klebsiella pneumoniae]VUG51912.1 morphogenetic protein [Klebsiella pneumoniae]